MLGAAEARQAVDRLVELKCVLAVVGLGDQRRPGAGRPRARAEERLAALDVDGARVEDEVLRQQRPQRVGTPAAGPRLEVRARDARGVPGAHGAERTAEPGPSPNIVAVVLVILGGLGAAITWATATLCSSSSSRMIGAEPVRT